jgi:hypothetical protein
MKRWGTITLVLFAFVVGFASTYSCGGSNGTNAIAADSGYVSVPFMPAWIGKNTVKREYGFDDTPGDEYQHQGIAGYADSTVLWNGWMSAETDTSVFSKFFVPIQLPDGATITSFHIVAYDNDPTYDGLVRFRASGPIARGTGGYRVATSHLSTDGAANVPRTFTTDSINPSLALVDNLQYSYYLEGNLYGGTDVVLMSAVVGYEFQ